MLPIASALALILIWSTTALAIKWSVTGLDYTAALFFRFVVAFAAISLIVLWHRRPIIFGPALRKACWISGISTVLSMICTYWASQHISSGLVAVLNGLTPLSTSLFAYFWLQQRSRYHELLGLALAIGGLFTIFSEHLTLRSDGIPALLAMLAAVIINSAAIIKIKEHTQGLDMFTVSAGSMGICMLVAGGNWLLHGFPLPEVLPLRATWAVVYLALVGSLVAMSLYLWMIRECRPTQIALIPMMTTVSALWIGHFINHEVVTMDILIGSSLIVAGLAIHQWAAWRAT